MGRKVPLRCSVRIHRKLLRPFSDSLSSTTSLDRCSALESRLIRRKWSRILRLFESESDKIGPRDRLSPSRNHSMQDFLPALQYLTK
jgi:hypothetical protein